MAVLTEVRVDSFSVRIKEALKQIPRGRVATYGQVAAVAGNPRGARQVVRILHSSSAADGLPWYRVINAKGGISLPAGHSYELQRRLLEDEGVLFDGETVDMTRFGWRPRL